MTTSRGTRTIDRAWKLDQDDSIFLRWRLSSECSGADLEVSASRFFSPSGRRNRRAESYVTIESGEDD